MVTGEMVIAPYKENPTDYVLDLPFLAAIQNGGWTLIPWFYILNTKHKAIVKKENVLTSVDADDLITKSYFEMRESFLGDYEGFDFDNEQEKKITHESTDSKH